MRLDLQAGRREDHVEHLARTGGGEGRRHRRHGTHHPGERLPGLARLVLVEVTGEDDLTTDVDGLEDHPGVGRALAGVEAEVDARDGDRLATGRRDPSERETARPLEEGHAQPLVTRLDDVDPQRREDRRPAAPPVPPGPGHPAVAGEVRHAPRGEQPTRHLLQAEHVRVDGPHDARRGIRVLEEVAGVVGSRP